MYVQVTRDGSIILGKRGRIKGSESSRQRDPVLKAPVWVGDEPLKTHI